MAKSFIYQARDQNGRSVAGTFAADSSAAVAAHIRERGMYVTSIKEKKEALSIDAGAWLEQFRKVSTKDLAIFCRQFSAMSDAGLPLVNCLNVLRQQTANPQLRQAAQEVLAKVQEGSSLTAALRAHPKIFPTVMTGLIHAAEMGGAMDIVLQRLSIHYEKEHTIQQKVKSAMTYPLAVALVSLTAVVFILTFVFPTFISLFAGMKMELPWVTKQLIALSQLLQDDWPLLAAGAGLLAGGGIYAYKRSPAVQTRVEEVVLRLPAFGPLLRNVAVARLTRTLATLLRGGMPLITALDVVRQAMTNRKMVKALEQSYVGVVEGATLAACFQGHPIFPPLVVQMVAVGEESGALDQMLDKIADFYEAEVDETVNRLSSIIEPVMILILGGIVGLIVAAVMLPMFDLVTNMGR